MVEPLMLNFKVFTVKFVGVRKLRNFTVFGISSLKYESFFLCFIIPFWKKNLPIYHFNCMFSHQIYDDVSFLSSSRPDVEVPQT